MNYLNCLPCVPPKHNFKHYYIADKSNILPDF